MTASTNCDTNYNYNQGCGTRDYDPDSYGEGLNSVGGGFYALARSKEYGIKVWFWQRGAFEIPSDVLSNGDTVNPDWWGPPTAFFPTGDNCSYEKHFDAHQIVFDLTFCVRRIPPPLQLTIRSTHFVMSRAIGPVPIRFGRNLAVLPCLAAIVSCISADAL